MSLARLLDKQGRREEARTILAATYNWFTEGFDTADLKDAKALLEELGANLEAGQMQCAKCGAENPAGKRFCGDCGVALANRCAQCGADNPREKKFCGDCGTALAGHVSSAAASSTQAASAAANIRVTPEQPDASTIEGERKTVTALFADIKGSTELMEDLDPEEARAIIDPALKLMIEAVRRYRLS